LLKSGGGPDGKRGGIENMQGLTTKEAREAFGEFVNRSNKYILAGEPIIYDVPTRSDVCIFVAMTEDGLDLVFAVAKDGSGQINVVDVMGFKELVIAAVAEINGSIVLKPAAGKMIYGGIKVPLAGLGLK